jgi:hypothetical protein
LPNALAKFVPGLRSRETILQVFLLDEANGLEWLEMPTVFRQDGFDVMIYTDDHPPAHVHRFRAGEEVVINLGDDEIAPEIRENKSMSNRGMRNALRLVAENQLFLLAE